MPKVAALVLVLQPLSGFTPTLDDRAGVFPLVDLETARGQPPCECSEYAWGWFWAKWNAYRDPDTCGSADEAEQDEFVDGCRDNVVGRPLPEDA